MEQGFKNGKAQNSSGTLYSNSSDAFALKFPSSSKSIYLCALLQSQERAYLLLHMVSGSERNLLLSVILRQTLCLLRATIAPRLWFVQNNIMQ